MMPSFSASRGLTQLAWAAEVAYGPAISLALQGALDGHTELTPDLATELSIKRPHQHEQLRRDQIESALNRMAETIDEERARTRRQAHRLLDRACLEESRCAERQP